MKYTIAISLLVASAAGMPSFFRRDAVSDAVAQFDKLSGAEQADFLDQISQVQGNANANANAQAAGKASSGSGNGKDVVANVDATAVDDAEANVDIEDSDDIQVTADVQASDDGVVNMKIQGLEDVSVQMSLQATDGAVANVTVDKGSVNGWGKEGGAACPDNLKAKRVVASMGFCVPK